MIPIENSLAGRVADIHHFLPGVRPAHHRRIFPADPFPSARLKARRLEDLRSVYSHVHALGQCRKIIKQLRPEAGATGDTAGSAREVAEWGDKSRASLAPQLAAEIYGLDVLARFVEDEAHNTTRFVDPFARAASAPAAATGR